MTRSRNQNSQKEKGKSAFRLKETLCTFEDIFKEIQQGKIWNIPNAIMLVRLVLGILSIHFLANNQTANPVLAIPIAALMFFLDFLDGTLARKLNQQTIFGKTFDPLIDKVIIFYGIFTLFNIVEIPISYKITFFSTQFIMVVGSIFLMVTHRAFPAVRSLGAISNILAVTSALFFWLGYIQIGKKVMQLAIASGFGLIVDYIRRIKWKREEKQRLNKGSI